MHLPTFVLSFGFAMQQKYGEKVHKVAINASFTCPNRDGQKGIGGCTFCNNVSFSPHARKPPLITEQICLGKKVIHARTGAKKFIAYFQAYTNTYADIEKLKSLYDQALADKHVIGLSIGTRPDCVPDSVMALLADYQQQGHEVWLELGLQSAFNETLDKVNRGHGFEEYRHAIKRARRYDLQVCTHLIAGLPGEDATKTLTSLAMVLNEGTQGLKLHPLHVVKGTLLANQWRRGEYVPLVFDDYIQLAADIVMHTPDDIIFHRLTATAQPHLLLAPFWCAKKWHVLNSIHDYLMVQGGRQASKLNVVN